MYTPSILLVSTVLFCASNAYPGEYIPKAIYVLDSEGHESPVAYFRNKRDLNSFLHQRFKRGDGNSGTAYSGSWSHSGSGSGGAGIPQGFPQNLHDIINHAAGFASPGGPGGTAGGPGVPGGSGAYYSTPGGSGGSSAPGPQLFSRFGEGYGNNVHVSGSAQGPNGAFSSSHSSVDSDGRIKYGVQSGKY